MTPSHHISRTHLYLTFAVRNTAEGDLDRAAQALARAVSHAATAIGTHWNLLVRGRPTRRRLQFALDEMAHRGIISHSLAGVMRQAYDLPNRMADAMAAAPDAQTGRREVIRLLRRTRTRARRLLRRILTAMAADPNPPAFAEIRARAAPCYPSRPSPSSSATHGSSAHFTRTGYCRTTASAASSPSSAHTAGGSGLPSSKSRNSCDKSAAPATVRPSTPSASSDADAWMMLQPSARALTPAITAPPPPAAGPSC